MNYSAIRAAALAGDYCDVGHYHCPQVRDDGAIVFPSGILHPDGRFHGAARLRDELERVPADAAAATPVPPESRYPQPSVEGVYAYRRYEGQEIALVPHQP